MSGAIRLGAAAALLAPLAYYIGSYVLRGGAWDDLPAALVVGAFNSGLDLIEYAFTSPLKAMLFIAITWAVGRLAFGR